MPGRRAFLRRRHVSAAAAGGVRDRLITARLTRVCVVRPLKAGPTGELATTERYRVAGGRSGTDGIEPLAKNAGACPVRAHAAAGAAVSSASAEPVPVGSGRSQRRPSSGTLSRPARPEPSPARQHQALTEPISELETHEAELVQQTGADQEIPAAVTAATAKTPMQITCPRRSPGPAAVTAKTPKNGLEITADQAQRPREIRGAL
jgi:hypothetical protein